jgi:hypothetical protein
MAGGVSLLASRGTDDVRVDTPVTNTELPAPIEQDPESLLYLVADPEPAGMGLVGTYGPSSDSSSAGSPEWIRVQRWAQLNPDRSRAVATFDIQWGPGTSSQDPLAAFQGGEDVTIHGRPGVTAPDLGAVAWLEPDNQVVLVSSQQLDLAAVTAIAESTVVTDDGTVELPDPPAGFELAAEQPGMASSGVQPRAVAYQGPGSGIGVFLVDDSDEQPGMLLYFPEARIVDVRGRRAVLAPRYFSIPGANLAPPFAFLANPQWVLQWEEGSTLITAVSIDDSPDALVETANSLKEVDYVTWTGTG